MGVAFVGQYLAMFLALSPRNEQKLPALTACRDVDLTGDPTVQCRYSMRFFVDGRSYAWRWYSVDCCGGILVTGQVAGAVVVGMAIVSVGIGLLYIVGGSAGATMS